MESDNKISFVQIDELNDDCLMYIFKYLPIIDLIRAQRVCKRWYFIGQVSWKSLKKISVSRSLWGINNKTEIKITRDVLQKILNLTGNFIEHVDLAYDDIYYSQPDSTICIQSCKNILLMLHDFCPNVSRIHLGRPCNESAVEVTGTLFKNLTHFEMQMVSQKFEECTSGLFYNLKNLKCIRLLECTFTSSCFMNLNPNILEEFHLMNCFVDTYKYLVTILNKFKSLHTLSLKRCYFKENGWVNKVLKAISSNSKTLRYLDLHFSHKYVEPANSVYMTNLKNLQRLCVSGNILLNDEFLSSIGNNCNILTELLLNESHVVTDAGILKITKLPKLLRLEMKSLTKVSDRYLCEMSSLKKLECHRCPEIREEGLLKLIRTSENIASIKLYCCENICSLGFLDNVINSKSAKLAIYIDTSEIAFDFILNTCLILKFDGCITKKIKRQCYSCFKMPKNDNSCSECCDINDKHLISKI